MFKKTFLNKINNKNKKSSFRKEEIKLLLSADAMPAKTKNILRKKIKQQ